MITLVRVIPDNVVVYGDAYIQLRQQLDNETTFMAAEPGERKITIQEIEKLIGRNRSALFLVLDGERVVGFAAAIGGNFSRTSKRAELLAGILQEYANRGVAQRLFAEFEAWARSQDLHRLELSVTGNNDLGLHLYPKLGFVREGVKRESLQINGEWVDEIIMAKIFD